MPTSLVLRDHLGICRTRRELRKMLHKRKVFVNTIRIQDVRFPIGYLDTITIPDQKKSFRIILNTKGKLITQEIDEKEATMKLIKVTGKTTRKGNCLQLNCNDGRNIIVEKDEYKVGDTLSFDLEKKKITETFHLQKGSTIQLTGGKHMGKIGKVIEIKENLVKLTAKNEEVLTLRKYAFVLGKENPIITVIGKND